MKHFTRWPLALAAGALGLLAIALPPLLDPGSRRYDAPLFPLVRAGVESFGLLSAFLLFLAGAIVGARRPPRAWLWGMATLLPLPLLALAEVLVDPTSHNLLPLEFASYVVLAMPAAVGAELAARRGVRRR
jgi:hypothetical protein